MFGKIGIILEIINRLLGFGAELWSQRAQLRASFEKFIRRSSADSQRSADLHNETEKIKKDQEGWKSK